MTKRLVGGTKDVNGIYVPDTKPEQVPPTTQLSDTSIDDLLQLGLEAIRRAMKAIMVDISTGLPSRETIQNLKDVMSMLKDLKKEEKDFIDQASDEQLEKMSKK